MCFSTTKYVTFFDDQYGKLDIFDIVKLKNEQRQSPNLWSASLSYGLLGSVRCRPGIMASKDNNEVLLAFGDEGLEKLVDLGFITCATCQPEQTPGFWDVIRKIVRENYGIQSLNEFVNKDVIPYDASRVRWEELIPIIGRCPDRLYLAKDMTMPAMLQLKTRFNRMGFDLPPVGFYDTNAPERFVEY
ncbi:hypothetical protein HQ545_04465 [Candidatus Woesearchaeota archaeon]|nr:hypothetical protein [Candidatus Woesearchaeota archaeon]